MMNLRRLIWTAVIALATVSPVAAQQPQTGGNTSGTQSTIGGRTSSTTQSGLNSGFGNSGFGSGSGFGSNSSFGGSGGNGGSGGVQSNITAVEAMPTLLTTNSNLQKSNVFSGYYANPTAMGLMSSGGSGGSFGTPTFGNAAGGTSGTSGGRGANTLGTSSSFGGVGGGRGMNNMNSANQSGIVVPIQTPLNYTAVLVFQPAATVTNRVHTEVRTSIDRSSMIANPKGVEVITDRNNNVTLRGTVADADEIRFIEGMVRLTPGVRAIRNELTPAVTIGSK